MRKKWTQQDIDTLVKLYPNNSSKDIAKILNRPVNSVYSLAHIHQLKKDPEYLRLAMIREGEKLKILGAKTRFKPGNISHNTGKQVSADQYEKMKVSFFKKGHEPHNIKFDGYERITKDGYVEIRIEKAKFKLKHRYIWEQKYGSVPKGHVIIFKDGNNRNFDINNLKMITMAENALRNQWHQYPKELKELIKLKNKLFKQINTKK